MNHYTVLLLYPDYLSEIYGHETYLTSTLAVDVDAAIAVARAEVAESYAVNDPEDLFVLAVFAGEHNDIKP